MHTNDVYLTRQQNRFASLSLSLCLSSSLDCSLNIHTKFCARLVQRLRTMSTFLRRVETILIVQIWNQTNFSYRFMKSGGFSSSIRCIEWLSRRHAWNSESLGGRYEVGERAMHDARWSRRRRHGWKSHCHLPFVGHQPSTWPFRQKAENKK